MIFIKDNFIDAALCEKLIESSIEQGTSRVINSESDKVLDLAYRNSKKMALIKELEQQLKLSLLKLLPEIQEKIKLDSNLEIEKIKGLRYEPGHFFKRHRDVGNEGMSAKRVLTAIIFLNDQTKGEVEKGYKGGELKLYGLFPKIPNAGFTVKGVAGKLVIFLSNMPHEVTTVEEGVRYSLVAWYLKVDD